jgi:hypothetical protein
MQQDTFTDDVIDEKGNGHSGHSAEAETTQFSDEELAALGKAASDLLPSVVWVGRELKFSYKSGGWYDKINKDTEEEVGATETFKVDARSYTEVWKRWGKLEGQSKRTVIDMIGGRAVDGWRNPPRYLMPETDKSKWPKDEDGEPADPWSESAQIALRRISDDQLFTWVAQYSNRRGMGELLDIVARDAKDHPGCMPIVLLEAVPSGKYFNPRLKVIGWEPFGEGASPPANAMRLTRLQDELKELHAKYAEPGGAVAAKGKGKRGDMDDEIPF